MPGKSCFFAEDPPRTPISCVQRQTACRVGSAAKQVGSVKKSSASVMLSIDDNVHLRP